MENKISETPVLNEQVDAVKHDVLTETTNLAVEDTTPATEQDVDLPTTELSDCEEGDENDNNIEVSTEQSVFAAHLATLSKEELIALFQEKLSSASIPSLRKDVELIKIAFYKVHRTDVEAEKRAFIELGGEEEAFVPKVDNLEASLKELFVKYRQERDTFTKDIEAAKENNLKLKLQIIEELKALIDDSDSLNQSFTAFRELQTRWKEVGAVPKSNVKDLWETYHLHVENFYSCIKINKELRDLDLKKNYEAKLIICEEAEELLIDESIVSSFAKLQKLHDRWREVGPVVMELKNQLWERFKDVSTKINKKHQDHFDAIKEEQLANLAIKSELCDKCDAMIAGDLTSKKEWDEASKELVEIQKIWKTIGFAPKKDNNKVYARFREACDKFFDKKREFFLSAKTEMEENLQSKISLCVEAEAVSQSDDWKRASNDLISLQKRWKEIGAIPRKESNALWARFRAACDAFFEKKSAHFADTQDKFAANLTLKMALLEKIKAYEAGSIDEGFNTLKELQREWMEIGFVPIKDKESIQNEYKAVIDKKFDALRGSEKQRKITNFEERVSTIKSSGNARKMEGEREKLQNKIKSIESDITIWENNIGFFSMSKNADSLVIDVNNKISKAKREISLLKEQITILNK